MGVLEHHVAVVAALQEEAEAGGLAVDGAAGELDMRVSRAGHSHQYADGVALDARDRDVAAEPALRSRERGLHADPAQVVARLRRAGRAHRHADQALPVRRQGHVAAGHLRPVRLAVNRDAADLVRGPEGGRGHRVHRIHEHHNAPRCAVAQLESAGDRGPPRACREVEVAAERARCGMHRDDHRRRGGRGGGRGSKHRARDARQ